MGVIYRNGKYYGGLVNTGLDKYEIANGDAARNISGSGLFTFGGGDFSSVVSEGVDEEEVKLRIGFNFHGYTDVNITEYNSGTLYILEKKIGTSTITPILTKPYTLNGVNNVIDVSFNAKKDYSYSINLIEDGSYGAKLTSSGITKDVFLTFLEMPFSALGQYLFNYQRNTKDDYDNEVDYESSYAQDKAQFTSIYYLNLDMFSDTNIITNGSALLKFKQNGTGTTYGPKYAHSTAKSYRTINGPTIEMDGPSFLNVSTGVKNGTPTASIVGNSFIDISDGSYINDNGEVKYYSEVSRNHWLNSSYYPPYNNKTLNGPWLHLHDNASLVMDDGAAIIMHNKGEIVCEDNGVLAVHGNAVAEFSGGNFNVHGGNVVIDDLCEVKISDSAKLLMETYGSLLIGGKSRKLIEGKFQDVLRSPDIQFKQGTFVVDGPSQTKLGYSGYINITNCDNNGNSRGSHMNIEMHGSPNIQIKQKPQIQFSGATLTRTEGVGIFQMHTEHFGQSDDINLSSSSTFYGPYIDIDDSQIVFATKGASWSSPSSGVSFNSNCMDNFGACENYYVNDLNDSALLIQGATRAQLGGRYGGGFTSIYMASGKGGHLIVDFQDNSKTYHNGSSQMYVTDNSYITFNGNCKIHIGGSSFTNFTGNSHIESHDNSRLIMRGPLPEVSQYATNDQGKNYKDTSGSYVRETYIKQPWQDGTYDGWQRPVANNNSPTIGIYEQPTILIRGVWNEEQRTRVLGKVVFEAPELEEAPTSIAEFDEYTLLLFAKTLYGITDSNDTMHYYYVSGGTVTTKALEDGGFEITVALPTVTNKPPTWTPHPEKPENSPVIEIAENSEVRLTQNFSIIGNNTGVTFSNGTKSIDFSFEELENLKTLLS